jgi:hypothetical protein
MIALGAARAVAILIPDNALPGIRYQLVKANNEQQSFALLDALAVYGERGRIAETQLKTMLGMSQSGELRQKIQQTLDRLRGKTLQLKKING